IAPVLIIPALGSRLAKLMKIGKTMHKSLRVTNKYLGGFFDWRGKTGSGRTAGGASGGGTGGRSRTGTPAGTCTAAVHKVCERLEEINAAVAHIADLLRLGQSVGDIARLGCRTSLQHQCCGAGQHGSAERRSPPRRVVAARIRGDYALTRS